VLCVVLEIIQEYFDERALEFDSGLLSECIWSFDMGRKYSQFCNPGVFSLGFVERMELVGPKVLWSGEEMGSFDRIIDRLVAVGTSVDNVWVYIPGCGDLGIV
jgi:hypothetical protein